MASQVEPLPNSSNRPRSPAVQWVLRWNTCRAWIPNSRRRTRPKRSSLDPCHQHHRLRHLCHHRNRCKNESRILLLSLQCHHILLPYPHLQKHPRPRTDPRGKLQSLHLPHPPSLRRIPLQSLHLPHPLSRWLSLLAVV